MLDRGCPTPRLPNKESLVISRPSLVEHRDANRFVAEMSSQSSVSDSGSGHRLRQSRALMKFSKLMTEKEPLP